MFVEMQYVSLAIALLLVFVLSTGIGLMNLIPIPPLDGGHMLLNAVGRSENIAGSVLTVVGPVIVVAFVVVITAMDILRIFGL